MEPTYATYLMGNDTLPFDTFITIQKQLNDSLKLTDSYGADLWKDVLQKAVSYTSCRAEYRLSTPAEKQERNLGQARTIKHNAFILSLTILKRYMLSEGQSVEWSDQLHLDDADTHRQKIGDFSNFLTLVYALNSR